MIEIQKHRYKFRAYSRKFPKLYEKERTKLIKILPKPITIEHVGSTSIPGLGGKGFIDIAVSISRKDLRKATSRLKKLGFIYSPNHPANNKRVFMRKITKENGKENIVNIHLVINKSFYESFISFRDYLRKNKKAREQYAKIKRKAMKYANGNGMKYHSYKSGLIENMQKKAFKEWRSRR